MTAHVENGDAVAIVGLAARLPGARDVPEFWRNLRAGVESVERLDPDVARERELDPAAVDAPTYRPVTATAADLDQFDPEFFGLTQREAELCDPQFRLFLELSYTALNDAGYDPRRIGRRVGVFGGATTNRYRYDYIEKNRTVRQAAGVTSVSGGNNADYIAPLVSYRLGFMGPSVSVYTACSTSLVAVHQAMQALRRDECEVAIAGGVQVDVPLGAGYHHLEGGIMSRDGHVRPFAADAGGTIFADGGALVVLKPLAAALAAGDQVYAVIRGSAVNNDGDQRVGFTAPGVAGQQALIRAALADARVHPDEIGMVEAHGTATKVGDPIEVAALTAAYREHTARRQYCWLGSVKGNVGHLGPAAGTVGLLKAILAVREGAVAPTLNCDVPNPAIDLPGSPFRIAHGPQEWSDPSSPGGPVRVAGAPRIAAVSSFGIGGTNAHVIIEQPPASSAPSPPAGPVLWPVSARSAEALTASCTALAEHLQDGGYDPGEVAFTLQEGRAEFPHRRVLAVTDLAAAVAQLTGEPALDAIVGVAGSPEVVFLFPGQGAQFPGAGHELYRTFPAYRDAVDECADRLAPLLGFDLRELLHAGADDDAAVARLNETAVTQPALFTVEWALARLLLSFGVRPAALLGHSIGEIVAATLAGVFTLPDALNLVARRGQLMQALPPGGMLSLPLGTDAVQSMLPDELDIAASNSPSSCVVSGEIAAVERFAEELADIGIAGSVLRTSHAFHSRMMAPICDELAALVESFPRQAPRIRYGSNVTGDWITAEQATSPAYWAAHVRQEVRLADFLARLADLPGVLHLQVGPGQSMCIFARQHAASEGRPVTALTTMAPPNGTATDVTALATTVGRLWVSGVGIDWAAVRGGPGRRTSLPGYPYQRRRCWVDPDPVRPGADDDVDVSTDPLLTPLYLPAWRSRPVPRRTGSLLGETWLVLGTAGHPVAAELVAAARERDVYVLPAWSGPGYVAAPDGHEFDPDCAEDVELLVEAVHEAGLRPDRIVYALFEDPDAEPGEVASRSYQRMAALAKAMLRSFPSEVELVAVTDRVWSVAGEPALPAGATIAGPLRTLPRELGTVRVRQIDACLTDAGVGATVAGEIGRDDDTELLALRGGRRWVHHHVSIPNEPAPATRTANRREVLLVTGGLGGLGLAIAHDVASRPPTDFALLGRTGLPDRATWDDPDVPAETRDQIAAVRRIEATGSRVLVLRADVTDAAAMADAVDRTQEELGPITGIVHAAGIAGGQLLALHDPETAERVLAPKVRGTLVIDGLIRAGRLPALDHLALFSSIVAVTADYGHSNYAAANTFLDAYAAARADATPYVVAINWWGWQEVGMVSTDRAGEGFRTLQRLRGGSSVTALDHPLLHRAATDGEGWTFEVDLDRDGHWVLTDHRIDGVGVLPGTSLLEMAHTAARHVLGPVPIRLADVVFIDPVRVTGPVTGTVSLTREESGGFAFAIRFAPDGQPATTHCRGRMQPAPDRDPAAVDVAELREGLVEADAHQPYSGLVEFGERFRAVRRYWAKADRGLVELELPAVGGDDADRYTLHPALVDRAVYGLAGAAGHRYLPFLYRSVEVRQPVPSRCWVVQTYRNDPARPEFMEIDGLVVDAAGTVCVAVEGYTLRSVDLAAVAATGGPADPAGAPRGTGMLTNAEGGELFRRILGLRPGPQVITSVGALAERLAEARTFDQQAVAAGPAVAEPVRTIGTNFVPPQTPAQRELARLWGDSLGVPEVGIDDDFFLLGGSSLTVVQLVSRIRETLSLELSAADMFEYPTIRKLAAVLGAGGVADATG